MNRTVAAVATLAVLAGAGCAAEDRAARPAPSPAPTRSLAPSRSPSPTVGPPLTGAPMRAADGRNTAACADGACEVFVAAGTQFHYRDSNGSCAVDVDSVGAGGIALTVIAGVSGTINSGPHRGPFATINDVTFVAEAVHGGSAVLRLTRTRS